MPSVALRILFVGTPSIAVNGVLGRLATRGWGARIVDTLREAKDSLQTFPCEIVLASEGLPDGRGYELAELVTRHAATLFVSVALSESFLWLPVVEQGSKVLGSRAFRSHLLETEVDLLLSAPAKDHDGQRAPGVRGRAPTQTARGPIRSYRKSPAASLGRAPLVESSGPGTAVHRNLSTRARVHIRETYRPGHHRKAPPAPSNTRPPRDETRAHHPLRP